MVFYKVKKSSTKLISFFTTLTLSSFVAYYLALDITWPKQVPLKGETSYNSAHDTTKFKIVARVFKFVSLSLM